MNSNDINEEIDLEEIDLEEILNNDPFFFA